VAVLVSERHAHNGTAVHHVPGLNCEFLARDQEMLWRRWDDDDSLWLTSESWPILAN
jgi:hypothetical protein